MADLAGGLMVLLMALGALLILIAAVGIVRMPDLLGRMQASSKAGTLGTILILAGVALAHGDAGVVVEAILVIVFLFLTAPVAAHVIARAAQRSGSVVSTELVIDELSDGADAPARQGRTSSHDATD